MINASGGIDTDHETMTSLDGVQHGVVLDGRAHCHSAATIDRAEDGGVVGLGSTTGEDHLARPATEHVGDIVASLVDRLADLPGESVRTGRVGELLTEERQHRLDRFGPHRRRRRVVEVGVAVVHGTKVTPTIGDGSRCGRR